MKCENAKIVMMDLIYDEINEENELLLKEHVKRCSSCRHELADLRDSSDMLQTWQDKTPKLKMVFTEEKKRSMSSKQMKYYLGYPAAAAAVLLIFLSLANFKISNEDGNFNLSMSLTQQESKQTTGDQYVTYDDIKKLQNENLLLTNALIEERDREQNADNYRIINELAKGMEQRRQGDMDAILTSFTEYQQNNNERLYQTNQNFLDLLQYSGVQLKRDNKDN